MVEKWLLQVEDVMINSLRKVVSESVKGYTTTPRGRWMLDWPGQVVLCVSSIFWTSEVTESMKHEGGIQVSDTPSGKLWATYRRLGAKGSYLTQVADRIL